MMTPASASPNRPYVPGMRWWICGLLFIATTTNYIDRNSLSVLKPMLEKTFSWTEADYGWIVFGFSAAYALFPSFAGALIDKFGIKKSFAAGVILWSLMCAAHALVPALAGATTGIRIIVGFAVARFLLGAAETTNFPASIKTVARWFPQKERAVATGIFNSGTNFAVMISAFTVWLAETFGWQASFLAIGAIGLLWLIVWIWFYREPEEHPMLDPKELAYIQSDQPQPKESSHVPWAELLRHHEIWPFLIGKFLTDPVWWFFLYWLPSYLHDARGLDIMKAAGMLFFIYSGATVGSIAGGWISAYLIGRGWKVGSARYMAMLLCVVSMPGSILAYYTGNFYLCVALIALATASHQGWSANIYTTASDLFPSRMTGAVVGLGQMTGAIGGMFMSLLVGLIIQWTGKQAIAFIWAGLMHPLSLLIFYSWIGKDYKTVEVDKPLDMSKSYTPLILGGLLTAALGAGLTSLMYFRWTDFVTAAKGISGASAAITAAIGIILMGFALIYAGLGGKRTRTA